MHQLQQARGDLPLQPVLRVVRFRVALSPPADQQDHRHRVDRRIRQAGQRVHSVSLPAVLHIHQRDLPAGKVVSRRDGHRVALVGRDHVPLRAARQRVVAETVQVGIRNAGKECNSVPGQFLKNLILI